MNIENMNFEEVEEILNNLKANMDDIVPDAGEIKQHIDKTKEEQYEMRLSFIGLLESKLPQVFEKYIAEDNDKEALKEIKLTLEVLKLMRENL